MPPELARRRILGAVIAGGKGRRFGSDKALAMLEHRHLIDHVLAGLGAQCDALVICGRHLEGIRCLEDLPQPQMGPLGGLAAALHHARRHGFDAVLTSACDTPYVPVDLAARLRGAGSAIMAGQPLFGFWPSRLADDLLDFMQKPTKHSMRAWAAWVEARVVDFGYDVPNINRPEDLDRLQHARAAA
ncbi:molybdenum cofactor guanylyltransferase [Sphingomonas piscis]|uniref:Molybdenum cofactor guanylyltransferase n=1 Tax=Sphingomonas piscis TaxID=2714943 RepID=A0A6G7YS03_9SPHN|nr:molybdenum cofactor guanylyltransferase [Sphingomonas piscis]QIK79514.1 molybdenum cofactor guanylyltransferase [Sphingomonas piscis]